MHRAADDDRQVRAPDRFEVTEVFRLLQPESDLFGGFPGRGLQRRLAWFDLASGETDIA